MGVIDEDARERIDEALRDWRQGDCVLGEHWFLFRLKVETPLTEEAAEAASEGADAGEAEVRGFMVATQTCDIVRSCGERPFIEVCPLVEFGNDDLQQVERGRRPRYAFVPGVAQHRLVADLDRIMTVEKSVVASWERASGCRTDEETRRVARALARKRRRFAFPEDFTRLVRRLQNRLQDKHDRNSEEGRALRALREIRVRAAPSWGADKVEITFLFIRDDDAPGFEGSPWYEHRDAWLALVPPSGRFHVVDGLVVTLDDLTARDYVESDPLDLDHLSSRDATA